MVAPSLSFAPTGPECDCEVKNVLCAQRMLVYASSALS
jgi:hypothetical protein